jgi:hypothetical protein
MPIKVPPKPVINLSRKQRTPVPRLGWMLWILPAVLVGWLVYHLALPSGGINRMLGTEEVKSLYQEIDTLKSQNEDLVKDLAKAQRNSAIDSTATLKMQEDLASKEDEIKSLKEELSFYQSVISPEGKEKGLNINSFSLSGGANAQLVHFRLVLTQVGSNNKAAKGLVMIRLQGKEGETDKTLEWWDIRAESNAGRPVFDFKYFQRLEGDILVPANFTPENILIKVLPEQSGLNSIQQSYSWQAILQR